MKLSELNLQIEKPEINIVKINGIDVEVYSEVLPVIEEQIIFNVLKKSYANGYYSPYLQEMYLTLFLIENYTNIEFSKEDLDNEVDTYNKIIMSGTAEAVLNTIGEDTIKNYTEALATETAALSAASLSFAVQFNKFIDKLPNLMQQAADTINNFDAEKYQNVIAFAEAANGNRPVPQK